DVERFRRVRVDATSPETLYDDPGSLEPQRNAGFIKRCVETFAVVNFAEQKTGAVYLRLEAGVPTWIDRGALERPIAHADTPAGLEAAAPGALDGHVPGGGRTGSLREILGNAPIHTLGAWGDEPVEEIAANR